MPPPTSSHLSQQCHQPIAKTPPTRYCAIGVTSEASWSAPPHHWHHYLHCFVFTPPSLSPSPTAYQHLNCKTHTDHIFPHYLLMNKRYSRWPCRPLLFWVEGMVGGSTLQYVGSPITLKDAHQEMSVHKLDIIIPLSRGWTCSFVCPQYGHYYPSVGWTFLTSQACSIAARLLEIIVKTS